MDFMKLRAILTLDSSAYEKGLDDAEKTASGFGGKVKSAVSGVAKGMAVVGAAGAAAATAVGGIAKSAVDGYAESQQLVGGIETLFGEQNMGKVLQNANNAYKTAGMSANEYMNTTIQSAAAMINSLGNDQAKAAELMDMSITDMSDNVNKMGTSVEGVQDAYRGFSRGNFTMLDNLALGYSGTKEGMQSLLTKAEELEKQQGRSTKYSIDNYADIVQAIHVVQTEMGITGTTASEADKTISGSLASMKTAWQNLLAGLADPNADLGQLISNMVESGKTALNNIIPAFKQAVKGVAELIKAVVPIIKEELPGIIQEIAPPLIEAAAAVISALISALPTLINVIIDMLPEIMQTIGKAVSDAWPEITKAVMDGLGTTGGQLIAGVLAAWTAIKGLGIVGGIANAISAIIPLISSLANPVTAIVAAIAVAAVAIIKNWDKIKAAWGVAVDFFKKIWSGITEAFKNVGTWISDKFNSAYTAVSNIWSKASGFFSGIWSGIKGAFSNVGSWLGDKFMGAYRGITTGWQKITGFFGSVKEKVVNVFTNLPDKFLEIGKNLLSGLGNGLVEGAKAVIEKAKKIASDVLGAVKSFFGVASPSKEFAKIGGFLMAGMAKGIDDNVGSVIASMGNLQNVVDANTPSMSFNAEGNAGAIRMIDGITMNIYGAQGQDVNALADAVADRFQTLVDMRAAVWA